jgi:hypothetical protein
MAWRAQTVLLDQVSTPIGTKVVTLLSAVCIKCGSGKALPLRQCTACGFLPSSVDDEARSLILSRVFDAGETVVGLSAPELALVADQIQGGKPYAFDPQQVARVSALHVSARRVTPRRLAIDLARWLLPPLVLLAGLSWLVWH